MKTETRVTVETNEIEVLNELSTTLLDVIEEVTNAQETIENIVSCANNGESIGSETILDMVDYWTELGYIKLSSKQQREIDSVINSLCERAEEDNEG